MQIKFKNNNNNNITVTSFIVLHYQSYYNFRCALPTSLSGANFLLLNEDDIICTTKYLGVYAGLSVLVALALLGVLALIGYRFRANIKWIRRWTRYAPLKTVDTASTGDSDEDQETFSKVTMMEELVLPSATSNV